ncbi:MAG TPA: thymidine phosphorylase family protein [Candidatus Manganitrophaceae bacterium]|nr:thymidine phosphorylase family protein [Candidatus Manganitrophaceae bacterium]
MEYERRKGALALRLRRIGIDTYQQPVIYMRRDSHVCRSEGFEALSRVQVAHKGHTMIATLNIVNTDLLTPGEAALSEPAWRLLDAKEGDWIDLSHPPPLESLRHVRAKVYGKRLDEEAMKEIIQDVVAGRYSDVHLASFITASAGDRLDASEMAALTRAMIEAGERLHWSRIPVMDKHSVGGLPGNRTTLLIVPIVSAFGLTMPKTSSRAITSPAGTADTMETLAPVALDIPSMRRVVDQEGGCIVWGGSVRLSPADDVLIRVERPLELDSNGQIVASILSKKAAAGSTHVVIDMPIGETAKVRSIEAARNLRGRLEEVGRAVGLNIRAVFTDGSQPVGCGIGPALEARDALAVLRCEATAPPNLRERALILAGAVLELSSRVPPGEGYSAARAILDDGRAWRKFQAICKAQGGMREPRSAGFTWTVEAERSGKVVRIDNRRLARVAKLSGAPQASAAGVYLHAFLGARVEKGQPLFTIHAESPGEMAYALAYVEGQKEILRIEEGR